MTSTTNPPSPPRQHDCGAGKRQLARLRTVVQGIEDEFLAPLDADTRATLHGTLLTLAENTDSRFVLDAVEPAPAARTDRAVGEI